MASAYDTDRRDPIVKRLEREGLEALIRQVHAVQSAAPESPTVI